MEPQRSHGVQRRRGALWRGAAFLGGTCLMAVTMTAHAASPAGAPEGASASDHTFASASFKNRRPRAAEGSASATRLSDEPADGPESPYEHPLWGVPDLGVIRYTDPRGRRELWLGVDAGGVYVPEAVGVFDRTAWTLRSVGSWAFAVTPMLALGGRHGIVIYDAENIRLQVHEHQLEVSGMPSLGRGGNRWTDRLSFAVEFHTLRRNWVDGRQFLLGGVRDVVVGVGYGSAHRLGDRWRLDWNVQGRYVWVFLDEQRQLRLGVRPVFIPRPGHTLSLEAVGFLVGRDPDQFGEPLPRIGVHGQLAFQYAWLWNDIIGPVLSLRYMTSFMSGEAPVYEIRREAINASYGELHVGLRAVWR